MARKVISEEKFETVEESNTQMPLANLVDEYGVLKEKEKEIKDTVTEYNSTIKQAMGELNTDTYSGETYMAVKSVQKRQSLDNEKLLSRLKELKEQKLISNESYNKAVIVRETVKIEAVEDLIYEHELDAAELSKCLVTQNIAVLKVKKIKK